MAIIAEISKRKIYITVCIRIVITLGNPFYSLIYCQFPRTLQSDFSATTVKAAGGQAYLPYSDLELHTL